MSKPSKSSKSRKSAKVRYYADVIDDAGRYRAFTGYPTALAVAGAVASLYDGVDAEEFALTWNAMNASGSTRFEIGVES